MLAAEIVPSVTADQPPPEMPSLTPPGVTPPGATPPAATPGKSESSWFDTIVKWVTPSTTTPAPTPTTTVVFPQPKPFYAHGAFWAILGVIALGGVVLYSRKKATPAPAPMSGARRRRRKRRR